MRIKAPLLILLIILFFSCDKKEDKITEKPIPEVPVVVDEKKPELTVSGFTEIIETNTDVSISIVDESTVETKVMHDGEEIASSTEKQFEISINPYSIPVGSTDFIVVSTDAKGNEVSETFSAEIKHLLFTYGHSEQADQNESKRWLFFNSLDGKELAVVEPTVGDTKIYTDEIVLEDNILYSFVNYNVWMWSTDSSNKNLHVSTYKIPLGGVRPQITYDEYVAPENTLEVKLNGIPFVNGNSDYNAYGYKYYTSSFNGDEQETVLTITHDASRPICIRTNRWGGSTPKFDGKKENYKHVFITPETGNTSVEIESNQLIQAENNTKLDIPEQDPGTLFFARDAYESSNDFILNRYTGIYDKDSSNETEMADYIDLPVFPMFGYYHNNLSYGRDGVYYNASGPDEDFDVNMPNWVVSAQMTDSSIDLTANNPEVDYYSIQLNKNEYEGNNAKSVYWYFNAFGEDGSPKILPRLEIPETIKEEIGETYFQTTDDLEITYMTAIDYAKYSSYNEVIGWFVFNRNRPVGGENKQRQLSFPISTSSGKSSKAGRPIDLDALHRYGLDEKGQVKKRR